MRKFILYSYGSTIAATHRATPEAPQMDSSWSLDSFTTIFLKIVQELTENATIDGGGGRMGGGGVRNFVSYSNHHAIAASNYYHK